MLDPGVYQTLCSTIIEEKTPIDIFYALGWYILGRHILLAFLGMGKEESECHYEGKETELHVQDVMLQLTRSVLGYTETSK